MNTTESGAQAKARTPARARVRGGRQAREWTWASGPTAWRGALGAVVLLVMIVLGPGAGQAGMLPEPVVDDELVAPAASYGLASWADMSMSMTLEVDTDDRFVRFRRYGQTRALTRQQASVSNSVVLSRENLDGFGDQSIEEALSRLPGVQADLRRQVNLRGLGRYRVSVDGQRMPSNGQGDRRVDLGSFSVDMARDVEVIRVLTPDMDADGLAGAVNIHTLRTVGDERELSGRISTGTDTRYFSHTGPPAQTSLRYSEAYRDDFTLSAGVSWHQDYRGRETLGLDYQTADFGDGAVDVLESLSPGLMTDDRRRVNGGLQMHFMPSEGTRFHFRGSLNFDDRDLIHHRNTYAAGGDWTGPDSTGVAGGRGTHSYALRYQDTAVEQYMIQVGGTHAFSRAEVRLVLEWGQNRYNRYDYVFPFGAGNLNYAIDMSDRSRPDMTITNAPSHPSGVADYRRLTMQDIQRTINDHYDNTYSGRLDLDLPLGPILVKAGASARLTNREGDFTYTEFGMLRRPDMSAFARQPDHGLQILDHYGIPRNLDAYGAESYFSGNRWTFSVSESRTQFDSAVWNHEADEQIYGGYGMASYTLGGLDVVAGLRMEHTGGRYQGRKVRFDDIGSFRETADTVRTVDYTHLFPHAQLGYTLGNTRVRAAWSRSLDRPDYRFLAPFLRIDEQGQTLLQGNPDLDPMISQNLDGWIEHYFAGGGMVSAGVFAKELDHFVHLARRTVEGGEYEGWEQWVYVNSPESARLYGVEVSWQQHLRFLPGALGNLSSWANYTWTGSDMHSDARQGNLALVGQSPHAGNASLMYDQGRFSARVSWHWTGESLSRPAGEPSAIPASGGMDYRDRYTQGWTDVSAGLGVRISDQFRFWADAWNLLPRERVSYEYDPDYYPVGIEWVGGRTFRAGIEFAL